MTSAITTGFPNLPFSALVEEGLPQQIASLARTITLHNSLQALSRQTGRSRSDLVNQHLTNPEGSPLNEQAALSPPITSEELREVEFMPSGNLSSLGKSRQPVFLARRAISPLPVSFALKATEPEELTTLNFFEALMPFFNLSTEERGLSCRTPASVSLIQSAQKTDAASRRFFLSLSPGTETELPEEHSSALLRSLPIIFGRELSRLGPVVLVSEFIQGPPFVDFFVSGYEKLPSPLRERLFFQLGAIVILDQMCGNQDRIITSCLRGFSNFGNLMIEEAHQHPILVLIDNGLFDERSLQESLSRFFSSSEDFCARALKKATKDITDFFAGDPVFIKAKRLKLLDNPDFDPRALGTAKLPAEEDFERPEYKAHFQAGIESTYHKLKNHFNLEAVTDPFARELIARAIGK